MTVYPLAVYTADHGMDWTYPRGEISLEELDRCRTVFGRLPDFDYGERGFEGVFADAGRVFAVRCQSDPGRDFRGRRAIYITVTWVPRGPEAARTDFEKLLAAPAMREPMKKIPPSFTTFAAGGGGASFEELPPSLPDFCHAGQLAAALHADACLVLKRAIGETGVSVRSFWMGAPMPPAAKAEPPDAGSVPQTASAASSPSAPTQRITRPVFSVTRSPTRSSPWPWVIIGSAFLMALAVAGWVFWRFDKRCTSLSSKVADLEAMTNRLAEVEAVTSRVANLEAMTNHNTKTENPKGEKK